MIEVNEQLAEVISNSRVAFINGQMAISLIFIFPLLISVMQPQAYCPL